MCVCQHGGLRTKRLHSQHQPHGAIQIELNAYPIAWIFPTFLHACRYLRTPRVRACHTTVPRRYALRSPSSSLHHHIIIIFSSSSSSFFFTTSFPLFFQLPSFLHIHHTHQPRLSLLPRFTAPPPYKWNTATSSTSTPQSTPHDSRRRHRSLSHTKTLISKP